MLSCDLTYIRFLTGDSTYNDVATQAILFQTGPDNDFEPTNQTRTEGNDDQAFWAFAAMTAAELKFPDPPKESPQWLALAQAVFNRQAERWDTDNCGGGLRWQFNPLNNGYNLKNTVSNGCFFLLASRLARYTQNDTYAQWANKTYDWMQSTGLIDSNSAAVYDSISFSPGVCPNSPIGKIEWTYNMGAMIGGSAFMWNKTQDETWKTRINNFLTHTQQTFFSEKYGGGKIMAEYACEPQGNCNADQRSFKAYLARWLALTAQLAPFTQTQIVPWLQNSAEGAAKVCDGDGANTVCGRTWYADSNDGTIDVGNQITAMSIVQSNLILNVAAPVDQSGGTSQGNPSAGGGKDENNVPDIALRRITTADKAGAWILTTVALGLMAFAVLFIVVDGDISTM